MRTILLASSLLATAIPVGSSPAAFGPEVSGVSRTSSAASGFSRSAGVAAASAQVPVPFPKPGQPPAAPPPAKPSEPPTSPARPATPAQSSAGEPTEQSLGAPIYPGAQFITSYDAGRGQRYYLFGTNAAYGEIVLYYRNVLKNRGDEVFREPPVHMFDLARFREQTMSFPPSVTIKDYAWGGLQGFLNPKTGAEPARYRTIIQIVPLPPGASGR